ncbi:MAG: ABC transporter permease, partial [Acidobacteriota bacterium]
MGNILSVFVLGLSFGLILFLLAAGLTLTMGLMRIVNMAHGALYMVGGYVGIATVKYTNNFLLGVLAGTAAAGLIGLLLQVGFLRRLYRQESSQVLLTIGFIYIISNVLQWIWGAYPLSGVAPSVFSGSWHVGSINIPVYYFFIIVFGFIMAALLWAFQERTKIGAMVRAGMDNREVAGALGINLKLIFTGIFVLGSAVAGLCGLVGASLTGMNLATAWQALLLSLIVVVVGGSGSIPGALLGGIIIGLLNSFGAAYFPSVAYYLVYAALIVILLVRPAGLLGRKMYVHGAAEDLEKAASQKKGPGWLEKGVPRFAEASSWRARLYRFMPYIVVLCVLTIVPQFLGTFDQGILTVVLIFAVFAMSLDLIMGYTGLVSFGHAAFFGMGGYAVGILTIHYGITSFWIVLPVSLAVTAALAAVIGYVSLRVSGVYFLLVTMAFGQLLYTVATNWYVMTGGSDGLVGISYPELGRSITSWTNLTFYYFVLLFFVIAYVILNRITKSAFGKTLVGIRENEPRMRSLGYNTWALKYVAVIIAGVFAGLAGLLYAYNYGTMMPDYFGIAMSALPMLMVIMGGGGTLWGPCLGAAVIVVVQQYAGLYMPDRWPLILGIIFVACVM